MANLQQITLTVDELTPAGTMLYPADGYEAIESVTFSGLWDYWPQNCDWLSVNNTTHGVLWLEYSYFSDAYPENAGNWSEDPSEIFLDASIFNPVLVSKNVDHSSSRCGYLSFLSDEASFYDAEHGDYVELPEMRWRLIEAGRCSTATARQFITVFSETSLTTADMIGGVVLKFLGTAYPESSLYPGSRGSYYAYFINTPADPQSFYLVGLESTAPNRVDMMMGDYVDYNQPNVINTVAACDWWASSAYDPMLFIKYLDYTTDY